MTGSIPDTFTSGLRPEELAVVVFDQVDYSKLPAADHTEASAVTGPLIEQALRRASLTAVLESWRIFRETGDGLVFGCAPAYLPQLLDRFLPALEEVLADHRSRAGRIPVRMRVAVTCGPVSIDGGPVDGNGAARVEAHRLVDASVLKAVMTVANPEATHVGAIVSDRVYQDVVLGRYCKLHPDRFLRVTATVTGKKDFRAAAWIHVPAPSAGLLAFPPAPPTTDTPPEAVALPLPEPDELPVRPVESTIITTDQRVNQGMAVNHGITGGVSLSFGKPDRPVRWR
ncbi:hypothetical protein CFP65_1384 [Kitasatospora sp. MMS16-BH015]|uniref:hypothetical protein n=1 Tax=Kitasatospora sp. MMS16-BH015 TaxID=2018025 RepID=UPI000CA23E0C|nr:hypothetical protein [Kitasatospora sp. MMS16-BH015]AUG76283.1 hypothetical protein CFP65_1384 [Kitasatospora sp. MMS16-BH015]